MGVSARSVGLLVAGHYVALLSCNQLEGLEKTAGFPRELNSQKPPLPPSCSGAWLMETDINVWGWGSKGRPTEQVRVYSSLFQCSKGKRDLLSKARNHTWSRLPPLPSKMQPVKKALHGPDSFNPTERFKATSSLLYCPDHSRGRRQ